MRGSEGRLPSAPKWNRDGSWAALICHGDDERPASGNTKVANDCTLPVIQPESDLFRRGVDAASIGRLITPAWQFRCGHLRYYRLDNAVYPFFPVSAHSAPSSGKGGSVAGISPSGTFPSTGSTIMAVGAETLTPLAPTASSTSTRTTS